MTAIKGLTIDLDYPVTVGGREYKSLSFRRMKTGDTLIGEDLENKALAGFKLFALLAGVDVEVIKELDLDDFQKIMDAADKIMGKTGAAGLMKNQVNQSGGAT